MNNNNITTYIKLVWVYKKPFMLMLFFCLFECCHVRMPRGQEKFVAIGDLQGWGYSNCDIRGYLAALSTLQVTSFNSPIISFETNI